jgi:hypothetical protein
MRSVFTHGLEETVAVVSYVLAVHGGGQLRFGCNGDPAAEPGTPQAIWAEAFFTDGRPPVRGTCEPTADYELGVCLALKQMLEGLGPQLPPIDVTILDAR